MKTEEIIQDLEKEKEILLLKAERIQCAIDNLKPVTEDHIKPFPEITRPRDGIVARGIKSMHRYNRKRASNTDVEKKKQKAEELLKSGKYTIDEVAEKAGCNRSSLYNWFELSKYPVKRAHKKVKESGPKCSLCPSKNASCYIEGKKVCEKCYDQIKYGPEAVERKEKKNPLHYGKDLNKPKLDKEAQDDLADLEFDDENLEE